MTVSSHPLIATSSNFPVANRPSEVENRNSSGVLAQLVERLNGIEEVRGSNPLGSRISEEILEHLGMRMERAERPRHRREDRGAD